MNFINQINLTIFFSEFIFCVHQDKSFLFGHLCSTFKQFVSIFLELFIILLTNQSLSNYFFFGDIFIMSLISLCCRSNNRCFEPLIFTKTFRQLYRSEERRVGKE